MLHAAESGKRGGIWVQGLHEGWINERVRLNPNAEPVPFDVEKRARPLYLVEVSESVRSLSIRRDPSFVMLATEDRFRCRSGGIS